MGHVLQFRGETAHTGKTRPTLLSSNYTAEVYRVSRLTVCDGICYAEQNNSRVSSRVNPKAPGSYACNNRTLGLLSPSGVRRQHAHTFAVGARSLPNVKCSPAMVAH